MARDDRHGLPGQVKPEHVPTTLREDFGTKSCKWCGSMDIVKSSIRRTKKGNVQRYRCRDCNRKFSGVPGFRYRRHSEAMITAALNMYHSGMSLRDIEDHYAQQGVDLDHSTVYKWVKRYGRLAGDFIETVRPDVSETWRTDEVYIKLQGRPNYLYAMIDHKSRYYLAGQMGTRKGSDFLRTMFDQASTRSGFIPGRLISDGAQNFHLAWHEFWRQKNPHHKETEHVRHVHVAGDMNNNRMERFNGTIREREVNYRGLKIEGGVLPGFMVHYNHVKRHGGLRGGTPGEAAGIHIPARNKWMTIIQNASRHYHRAAQEAAPAA
ncbi:MAG: DDE-type integrase/transposase/recombinase [Pirellulales bacterium]|nr:DDE-type integrase/transposase/recombinase [Pirellulales bacterium]